MNSAAGYDGTAAAAAPRHGDASAGLPSAASAPNGSLPAMTAKKKAARFSVSVPADLLDELDAMVRRRGFKSRSQAVAEMTREHLLEAHREQGKGSMAGTISLVYDHRKRNVQCLLADIQHRYYLCVVTSMHVHLEHFNYLEVLLVQGPVEILRNLADELITTKGVKTGRLHLTATSMPPLI